MRIFDLDAGRLLPGALVDRREREAVMRSGVRASVGGVARAPLLALTAAIVLVACSLDGGMRTFDEDGVSLRYPDGWHVAGFSTTNSPRRVAAASYPVPESAVEGDCGGLTAVELLPPDGALVILIDYGSGDSFPERPDVLRLGHGEYAEYECFGPSTMFRFRVGDRDLQAHVALGSEASETSRDRALAVLESIEVRGYARAARR